MNIRKLTALLLSVCLLAAILPLPASAYTPMTYSDGLVEFIKGNEGFTKYATWDYQQYSIGYGSGCNPADYPNGITEEEADALLRAYLVQFVDVVNNFCGRNGVQPSQGAFDCMVSLTYGLGDDWTSTSKYDLPKLILRGCGELELLNVLGDWVVAGGSPLDGLIYRRMRENYMFFHEQYNYGYIERDVPYACLKFDANGGSCDSRRLYTFRGERYGLQESLPTATRAGYTFAGWFDASGNRITNDTIATSVLTTAYARWNSGQTVAPPPPPPPADLFTDVYKADWFFSYVKSASDRGYFTGFPDGSFRPNASMTRAMFAQVLYRIAGQPKLSVTLPFTDVPSSEWYYDAVCWAYANGIVNGVSDTLFSPGRDITREQMAKMLFNYYTHMDGVDKSRYSALGDFSDAGNISGYALEPMQWAVGAGLINGVGNNRLSPGTNATRAQASKILILLTDLLQKGIA